jgi:hypothetical protein
MELSALILSLFLLVVTAAAKVNDGGKYLIALILKIRLCGAFLFVWY